MTSNKTDVSEILSGIRLSDSFYAMSHCYGAWGFKNPPGHGAIFHYLVSGSAMIETANGVRVDLEQGDLALLSEGYNHLLMSEPGAPVSTLESVGYQRTGSNSTEMQMGSPASGDLTVMVCGGVVFEPLWHPLFEAFPDIMCFRQGEHENNSWSKALVNLMGMEVSKSLPGSEAVITRLIEVLVIGAIRDWMLNNVDDTAGWIMAIRDNNLGHAIACLHKEPDTNWTVASLAEEATMSRTAFAEKFTSLVGIPPMQYLNHLRMNIAGDMLRGSNSTIAEIAKNAAYGSEISFSRAFKKFWGKPPGSFRKHPIAARQFGMRSSGISICV